ncbi:MAG: acyltransferase [Rhodoglobus sp.]|nr:acyltransferase [Rhodoglobus sp.]
MNRNQGIDLLRGAAVALVMLRHAFPEVFPGAGVVGVVMFFALSGHLITGLLLDELERDGRLRLRRFALNRALRLVPALVAMVAVLAIVTLVFDPLSDRDELGRTLAVALSWTANLPFAHGSDAIFHLWTLALEEQFHLLWPVVLLVVWRRSRVGVGLVLIGVAAVALCIASLAWAGPHPDLVYTFPTSWVLCFVIGAASRVLRDRMRVPRAVAIGACVVLPILAVVPLRGHMTTYLVAAPAIAALTALAILVAWREWSIVPIGARPLVALGTVSYAAYLWNYPITLWLKGTTPGAEIIALALTLLAAGLSWRLSERPIGRLARRSRASRREKEREQREHREAEVVA